MKGNGTIPKLPKLVGWENIAEWEEVRSLLFASDANATTRQQACDRMRSWRHHGKLPLGVEATLNIAGLITADNGENAEMARLSYAMAIIRFINGFCDKLQRSQTARSVSSLAAQLRIPEYLVDIRHDATHGVLPSLRLLRLAASHVLQWLEKNYWQAQMSVLSSLREQVAALLVEYRKEKEPSKKKKRKREVDVLPLEQIISYLNPNSIKEVLIDCLLSDFLVMSISADRGARAHWVSIWKDAIAAFLGAWQHFGVTFLAEVVTQMAIVEIQDGPQGIRKNKLKWLCTWFEHVLINGNIEPLQCQSLLYDCLRKPTRTTHKLVSTLLRLSEPPIPEHLQRRIKTISGTILKMPAQLSIAEHPGSYEKFAHVDSDILDFLATESPGQKQLHLSSGETWFLSHDPLWVGCPLGTLPWKSDGFSMRVAETGAEADCDGNHETGEEEEEDDREVVVSNNISFERLATLQAMAKLL